MKEAILEKPPTTDHPDIPASPPGYNDPYEYMASPSWFNLALGEVGMVVISIIVFVPLVIELYGMESILVAFKDTFTIDNLAYVVMVATVVATISIHEIIHAWVARGFGCTASVSVDIRRLKAQTEITEELLSRREDALITLAPLVSLTTVGIVLLGVGPLRVALVALVVLLTNAAGSGSDLAAVDRLRRFPPGTLTYSVDGRLVLYEPMNQ